MIDQTKYQDLLIEKCSICGFCYDLCPVYSLISDQSGFAPGQYACKKDELKIRNFFKIDNLSSSCLLCKACYPSCFSGMTTDELVLHVRETSVKSKGIGLAKRLLFKEILPYPRRMAFLMRAASILQGIGLISLARKLKIKTSELWITDAGPSVPSNKYRKRLLFDTASLAGCKDSITYFQSCGFDHFLPQVRNSTVKILNSLGYIVDPAKNACCGLPLFANGDTKTAQEIAKKNIQLLEGSGLIVTECGSCSSFLKKYPALLANETQYAERAYRLAGRIRDTQELFFSDLSAFVPLFGPDDSDALKVTYHDPCHLSRYQKITREPREIIKFLPGVEFIELPESDWCCGGPGLYSATNKSVSMKILNRKICNIRETGAKVVATSCPACIIQLNQGVAQENEDVRVMHINELIAERIMKSGVSAVPAACVSNQRVR